MTLDFAEMEGPEAEAVLLQAHTDWIMPGMQVHSRCVISLEVGSEEVPEGSQSYAGYSEGTVG